MNHKVESDGFWIIPGVLNSEERTKLIAALGPISGAGRRGLLALPEVTAIATSQQMLDLVRPHVYVEPFQVRAIYFDKSPDTNWLVAWHQDLTLAVRKRIETPGFGPWSVKDGVPHVQPPVEYLEQMLTVRLYLDDADESNGALRVLAGTHRMGRLSSERIQELRGTHPEFICAAPAGDALLMRPLLLHASGRSTSKRHRRVLHIEFAAFTLPDGLEWHKESLHGDVSNSCLKSLM